MTARVDETGLGATETRLVPMTIAGVASFGSYFSMAGMGPLQDRRAHQARVRSDRSSQALSTPTHDDERLPRVGKQSGL